MANNCVLSKREKGPGNVLARATSVHGGGTEVAASSAARVNVGGRAEGLETRRAIELALGVDRVEGSSRDDCNGSGQDGEDLLHPSMSAFIGTIVYGCNREQEGCL